MIIKSIYIDKFGGLSNKRIDFNGNLNIFYAENETGKSTVAEFIKIILFGMGRSPQNIRGNERIRFLPWGEDKMGGEITVNYNNTDYTIIRSFGKRKSEDTINVINTLTGSKVPEFCIDSPGEIFAGIGRDGFEKSLYIKQLSCKIEAGKDDEILNKLINLSQSGDDEVSYNNAMQILNNAEKELNGTRPRGKMLILQDEINALVTERMHSLDREKLKCELSVKLNNLTAENNKLESFKPDRTKLECLKAQYSEIIFEKETHKRIKEVKKTTKSMIILNVIFPALFFIASFFFYPLASIPFALWFLTAVILFVITKSKRAESSSNNTKSNILKIEIEKLESEIQKIEKDNISRLVYNAQQASNIKNELTNLENTQISEIDEKINELKEKYRKYEIYLSKIQLAKSCLKDAFEELQKSFGKRINEETANILKEITEGKYSEVLVDNEYNMKVRIADSNELKDAQYLSNGAYDLIYFALRFGIIHILFEDAPIILDEAFVQYDDKRLRLALEYLKKADNRQIILFTCHKREPDIFPTLSKVL